MCVDSEVAEAVASLRYLEPPQALDLEPATFDIPVSDAEIAEPSTLTAHFDHLQGIDDSFYYSWNYKLIDGSRGARRDR